MSEPLLNVKPAAACKWDCASLGEVMLRLDPGFNRIRAARSFEVFEGGGEYNVSRSLRKCWRKRTTVFTALPQNEVGELAEELIEAGGVDVSHILWQPFDGVGHNSRVGLYFMDKGFGLRAGASCQDRGHSAASQIRPGMFDWEKIFGEEGVRWFHTGGVFAGLDEGADEALIEAAMIAKKHGTIVSYDINFRPGLWQSRGGEAAARAVNVKIAPYVDVMIGNIDDYSDALCTTLTDVPSQKKDVTPELFAPTLAAVAREFPNLKVIAATMLAARTANFNDWSCAIHADGQCYGAPVYEKVEIFDRIGAGDACAAGIVYALLEGLGPRAAVRYGVANGSLEMTTPGDWSQARAYEVEALVTKQG